MISLLGNWGMLLRSNYLRSQQKVQPVSSQLTSHWCFVSHADTEGIPWHHQFDALSFPECPTLTYKVCLTLQTLHIKKQLCSIIFRQKCIMCLWPSTQPWPLTFLALLRFGIHIMLCHHWQWQTDMNGVKFSHMVPPEPGCAPMKRPPQSIYNWWGGHMNPIKSPCEVQLMEIHGKMGHFAWGSLTGF